MPIVDAKQPGQFCWVELATTDQPAAKKFYQSLFGWTADDVPMGPDSLYTMFKLNGQDAGACYALRPDQLERGVPVHWSLYVSTRNTDESTKRAADLGGNVILPPFDVMGAGRMAVLHDPTGAVFSLWQAAESTAHLVKNEEGAFCWADLLTRDREKAGAFYTGLFGWTIEKEGDGYYHIKNGDHPIGGMPPSQSLPAGTHTHWSIYFHTEDCVAKTERAKSLGARIFMPSTTIEKVGTMSVVEDPQGATFCIFQPARR